MVDGHLAIVLKRIHEAQDQTLALVRQNTEMIQASALEQSRMKMVTTNLHKRMNALEARIKAVEQNRQTGTTMTPHNVLKFLLGAGIAAMMVMEWLPVETVASIVSLAR